MKNLKSKLRNLGFGLGIAGLSLLPAKSFGQQPQDKKNISYNKIAFSTSTLNQLKDITNSGVGFLAEYGRQIKNEFYATLKTANYWASDKDLKMKTNIFEAGPTIEWHPYDIPGYIGIGGKYKNVVLKDTDSGDEYSYNGIGISASLGAEVKVSDKIVIYGEGEYDKTKTNDGEDIGGTNFTFGIKFLIGPIQKNNFKP